MTTITRGCRAWSVRRDSRLGKQGIAAMNASATSVSHPESIDLTAAQQQRLLDAVARMIRETVFGQSVTALPAAVANPVVSGTFVSLKCGKHLRGSCGGSQPQPASLGGVIAGAVQRTVLERP